MEQMAAKWLKGRKDTYLVMMIMMELRTPMRERQSKIETMPDGNQMG